MTLEITTSKGTATREITGFTKMPEAGVYVATVVDDTPQGSHDESFPIDQTTHFSVTI